MDAEDLVNDAFGVQKRRNGVAANRAAAAAAQSTPAASQFEP
ncbi:hypothetical protein ABT124_40055 [Streptomyces sp. NPDC001982]